MSRSSRLEELNVTLPKIPDPVGSYLPATRVGDLVVTSGQLPIVNGELIATGKVPDDVWDEYPRVCGTFNERNGLHPCQMPEALIT